MRHSCVQSFVLEVPLEGCAPHLQTQLLPRRHFYDENDTEVRLRRRGKPLRGCFAIFRDTRYGMAGRIITYQVHPWECATNYAALVAARCNVDVQDMRRVLPPELWMSPDELEVSGVEGESKSYNHGLYPQRYTDMSVGPQNTWACFQH